MNVNDLFEINNKNYNNSAKVVAETRTELNELYIKFFSPEFGIKRPWSYT